MNEDTQSEDAGKSEGSGWLARTLGWLRQSWSGDAAEIRSAAGSNKGRVRAVELFLFVREVLRCVVAIRRTGRAAALAFTTLLSLVPLIAALSQVFKAYFSQILPNLKDQLDDILAMILPYHTEQITAHLTRAAENSAAVSGFGTLIFFVISFRLFMTVEAVVNLTWKVEGARMFRQRVRAFTMLFFWGPIVIGLSMATTTVLEASPIVGMFMTHELVRFVVTVVVFFIAFTMLFWQVPATRVNLRSAALGGAVTTALFELVRAGVRVYSEMLFEGEMNVVYGTLGLLVVFLVALEAMWLVILLGVEISYVHQNFQGILRASKGHLRDDPRYDIYYGLQSLVEIVRRYHSREEPPTVETLAEQLGATDDQIQAILRRLEDANILCEVGGSGRGWFPAGGADGIDLEEVVRELEDGGRRRVPVGSEEDACDDAIKRLLDSLDDSSSASLGSRKLGDLVREVHGDLSVDSVASDPAQHRDRDSRSQLKRRNDE